MFGLAACGGGGDAAPTTNDAATRDDGGSDSATSVLDDADGGADPTEAAVSDATNSEAAGADASDARDAAADTGQWVLGYYVGYSIHSYPIASIDWSGLTHIAFAPMLVNADFTLDTGFNDEYGTGPADAKALSAAAHAHGVKALLMLGGAGGGARVAAAATAGNRATFVSNLLSTMASLGYDGIDLDWEDSVNLDDLVSLAQALRAAKSDIVLSYPGAPQNLNTDTVDPRMATLAASLDRFNVQTYAPATVLVGYGWSSWFSSPISGATPATPIAIDDTFHRYEAAGIPKSKLGMGIAFYAICYTGGISGPRQSTNGTTQTIVGGDNAYPLSALFAAGGSLATSAAAERKIDATAQVPYLTFAAPKSDPNCGSDTQYITYDDETSILAKGAWSKANGYGGVIVWNINEGWLPAGATGGRAPNALMQALRAGFL
jgi:chitinase